MAAPDLLDRPAPTGTGGDNELAHLVCCNVKLSLCGVRLAGRVLAPRNQPPPDACPTCRLIMQTAAPCASPDCPRHSGAAMGSRRSRQQAGREAQLDQLYAQLPRLECRGKCQGSCGPIDMSNIERRRIAQRGVDIPRLCGTCPALTMLGACAVYEIRPMICRLWGVVEAMACPHGCMPEGGWLDDATSLEFLTSSLQLGGRPATVPAVSPDLVRVLLADSGRARAVAATMRRHRGEEEAR